MADPENDNKNVRFWWLQDYHPYHHGQNQAFDRAKDGRILDIKSDNEGEKSSAVAHFFARLAPHIAKGCAVAVVPSSDPNRLDTGMRRLAQRLAADGRIDATSCLVRVRPIAKLASGGDRSEVQHRTSVEVRNVELIRGREVLLLDDVVTTGNSLGVCKELLLAAGAARVTCFALAKTVQQT